MVTVGIVGVLLGVHLDAIVDTQNGDRSFGGEPVVLQGHSKRECFDRPSAWQEG
jgi:hypothetical protein